MARNRPIEFTFSADVAKYLSEVKKMAVTTEDVEEALVAVTTSSEELERKLSKAMRDAASNVDVLTRAVKDIPKATDAAARETKKDFDKIGDQAADAGREGGKNLAGNLGEGLSSGNLSDTLQDTLGEMLGNISGPLSAALGAGAAIGLALWNGFNGELQKQKELLTDFADSVVEEFTGAIDKVAAMRRGVEELGAGDFAQGMKDAQKYAELLGADVDDIVKLVSGEMNPANKRMVELLQAQSDTYDELVTKRRLTADERERREAVREILATTNLTVTALEGAVEVQKDWGDATGQGKTKIKELQEYILKNPIRVPIKADWPSRDEVIRAAPFGGAFANSSSAFQNSQRRP